MLPRVVIHIGMSVDGRIDWGLGADNPYYDLVRQLGADTDLSGSETVLKAFLPEDPKTAFAGIYDEWIAVASRPMLVVVDSRGQIRTWRLIKRQPWWRSHVALCSEATPQEYLAYLEDEGVESIIAGAEHVDLRQALEELASRYGTRVVRIDSGGTLNGVMLRAGLIDEVSVVVSPSLVGGVTPRTIFVAPDLTSEDGVVPLELLHVETIRGKFVWLRYRVRRA